MSPLPRIAILGGGVGAVTAAVQLSKPGWEEHYESITIYQQGWRLGGKGASGRGRDLRIEEHGLHIWFGFYENAFRVLHHCHEELDARAQGAGAEPRWALPFRSVEDSFEPLSEISVTDHDGCGWKLWTADFFDEDDDTPWAEPDPRMPGERPEDWGVVFYLSRCLHLAADLSWSLVRSDPKLELVDAPAGQARAALSSLDEVAESLWGALTGDLQQALSTAAEALDRVAGAVADEPAVLELVDLVLRVLDLALDFLRDRYEDLVRASDALRRAYYVVDLMIAIARGLIEDGALENDSFAVIEDIDFRDWLLAHGATRGSVECALIRAIVYDLAFAYEGGDPQRPAAAAGTAVRGLLRAFFTYRGALMWRMNTGMGDAVFAPLYELLVKRGVDVRFFHRVEEVRVADDLVSEIEIDVQAVVPAGTEPLDYLKAPVTGSSSAKPIAVWPSDPGPLLKGGKVAGGKAKGSKPPSGERYESWYADRAETKVSTEVLRRGTDFDLVVFGLPVGCVRHVAQDLVDHSPRWKAAVDNLRTVPTQAMQLWLDRSADELAEVEPGIVVSGFAEPFDTWADMSQLVGEERVAGSETVAYFCNVLADGPAPVRGQEDQWREDQKELVKAQALRFLRHDVRALWPKAVDPLSGIFTWERLVAPSSAVGEARLDSQYLRANVEPSERYVLSVPGSSAHRIPPDDTGFKNLYAVGDWTACQIDAGCVEAAAISGMLAANAIHRKHGDPADVEPIIGRKGP